MRYNDKSTRECYTESISKDGRAPLCGCESDMKVIIAADSFKGSCSAEEAVSAMERGVHKVFPDAQTVGIPVADGGEGTVDALVAATGGKKVCITAHDPLGRPISAEYGVLPDGTAVVETAAASGLPRLRPEERDAFHATSCGTGELIRHALEHGARRLILGLGGSATTDGGMGLAQVLGVAFLDADGKALAPGGGSLARLARIETDAIVPQAKDCTFVLACDVRNQLCGTEGAAAVFGPQKGATPEQVALLDQALSRYASVLSSQLGSDAAQRDGAGAAGGIGCAMMAFFGASFLSGIDLVLDAAGFSTAVAGADLVLTGEGRLDAQSAYGKVPCGVARRAKAVRNVPVLAIGGALGDGAESLYSCGVDALASTVSRITTLESAMTNAVASIEEATARTMRLLDAGRKMEQNKVS